MERSLYTIRETGDEFTPTLLTYSFRKDFPRSPRMSHQLNLVKQLKEGCLMIFEGIKGLIKTVSFTGITINIGFIGLNFAGGSS